MATITSLDFSVKSTWDGSGLRDARADLDRFKADLDSISGKDITLSVDDSAARAAIDSLKADIDSISNKSITLSIDDAAAKAAITSLKADIDSISNKSITLSIDDTAARAAITTLKADIASISNKSITLSIDDAAAKAAITSLKADIASISNKDIKLGVDDTAGKATIASFKADLASVSNKDIKLGVDDSAGRATITAFKADLASVSNKDVKLGVDDTAGRAAITAFKADMASISNKSVRIDVDATGALAKIAEVKLALDSLHDKTVHVDVNTDSAHVHLGTLSSDAGTATRDLGAMASIAGGAGSALGGMGSAAGGAAGGVGSLGGSASSAGGSFGSMAMGIGLVSAAMAAFVALAPIMAASVVVVPLAFIGVAAMLIEKNKALKKSFQETFQDTMKTILPLAQPVMDALVKGFQQVDTWLKLIGPALHAAFSAAAPLVQPLLNIVEKLVGGALPGFTLAMQGMKPLLDGLGQGALKLGGYLGQAANVLARIPGLGQAMNGIMGALGQVILQVAKSIGTVVAADHGQLLIQLLQAVSVWLKVLTPLLVLNGFIWTGLAVIMRGVGDVLIALEVGFRAFFQMLAGQGPIIAAFKVAWEATWNGIKIFSQLVWDGMKVIWQALVTGIPAAWNAVSGALVTAWNAVWNGMKVAAGVIWDAMKVAWSVVVTAFSTVWTTVSSALVTAWNAVWNALKVAAEAIWTAMQVAWAAVVNAFATVWTTVSSALTTAWNAVWNALKVAAEAIWTAMQVAWTAVVQAFATVWSTVSSALTTAWNAVWNALKTAAQAIWTAMQVAWQAFTSALVTIWNTVSSALSTAWNAVWNALKTAAIAVWNALQTAWTAFWTFMRNLFNTAAAAIQTSWSLVWNAIKTVGITIWNAIQTAWNAFWSFIRTVFVGAMNAIKTGWTDGWNAIKTVGVAIWDFIKKAAHDIWLGMETDMRTFVSVAKTIWDGLKAIFEAPIHFVIATVLNGGIIKAINWVVSKLGGPSSAIPNIPVPFAEGGAVSGPGTGTSDSILARLSTGEHVWTAAEVQAAGGHGAVQQMRAAAVGASQVSPAGNNGGFATGGAVNSSGGLSIGDIESMFTDIIKSIGGAAAGLLAKGIAGAGSVAKFVGSGIQSAGNAVGNAAGHIPVVGGAAKSIIKGVAGFFGGGAKKVGAAASGIAGVIDAWGKKEFTSAASDLIKKVLEKLPIPGGTGVLGEMGSDAVKFMFGFVGKKLEGLIADFLFKKQQAQIAVTSQSVAGSKSVQAWGPTILQALQMEGHPASWVAPIEQTMQKESGGNPNAINRTDINAQHGIPSQGLMQVIPPTFARYHEAGTSNNILDPLANIAAAINYIVARYGRPTGMSPYATGTSSATPGVHLVGENGPEMVMFGGGETVKTASETSGMMGGGALPLDQMQKNLADWRTYTRSLADTSTTAWSGIKKDTSDNVTAMGNGAQPVLATMKSNFKQTGTDIAAQWKQDWTTNGTLFQNDLTTAQNNANNFQENLRKNFQDNGTALGSQWKQNWDTNGTVLANDLTTAQNNATNFQDTLKKNFQDNNTAVASAWKTAWDTNGTVFLNDTNTTQANATNFQDTLKTNFANNNSAVSTAWKTAWDTNQTVFLNDTNTTQTDATNFNNTLKTNFATNQTAVGAAWKTMWDTATTQANTDFTTMNTDATNMWTAQKATFTAGSNYLTGTFFPPVNDLLVTKLPQSFATSVSNIGSGWIGLENATRNPVSKVVDVVYNKGIVGVWNLIAKAFGAPPLSTFTLPGFAVGGEVNGPGSGTSDSIVARLSAGEHVWTASEVQAAGGHHAVAKMRSNVLGGSPVRTMGNSSNRFPTGGGVPTTVGGNPTTPTTTGATAAPTPGGSLAQLAAATLGSIHQIANPLIQAAVAAGKTAVDAVTVAGSGMRAAGENMSGNMGKAATDYITQNDVLPTFGGGSDASAQAWADSRVGEPYVLGGDFVHGIDCSEYQSGIAKAILGQTPGPWFTTFAFNGATAPTGFKQNLQAPYMVGVTNVGVGHMAGTLNGKNYEATPPAVRSGPSARGWNDPMFSMHYGFQPSIQALTGAVGSVTNANHLAIIDAALAAAGVPPPNTKAQWELGMNTLIQRESAWNPNAINLTDSNAAAGHPSQGLAQVIPSTFAAYHVPGTSSNILDPVANVAAAIRYIVSRYGSILSVQQANPNLPPLGYSTGTNNASPGWHMIDENGDEWVNFRGGEKVLPHGQWPKTRSDTDADDIGQKVADAVKECLHDSGTGGDVHVTVPITVSGTGSGDDVVRKIESELIPKLRMMMEQHVGRNRGRGH